MTEPKLLDIRALLDTNLYISYLLSRRPATSAIGVILAAARDGWFTLLFAPDIAWEIGRTVAERPDLSARVGPFEIGELLAALDAFAEEVPRHHGPLRHVTRDPKDDYLIAHAKAGRADYLVSWDKDLLDLGEVDGVKIVSPAEFLRILREAGLA